jgi:hypothetical protein
MKTLQEAIAELMTLDHLAYACREGDLNRVNPDDVENSRLYVDPKEPADDDRWLTTRNGEPFQFRTSCFTATDWVVVRKTLDR